MSYKLCPCIFLMPSHWLTRRKSSPCCKRERKKSLGDIRAELSACMDSSVSTGARQHGHESRSASHVEIQFVWKLCKHGSVATSPAKSLRQIEQLVLESSHCPTGRFLMVRNETGAFCRAARECKPLRRNNSERKYGPRPPSLMGFVDSSSQASITRAAVLPESIQRRAPDGEDTRTPLCGALRYLGRDGG